MGSAGRMRRAGRTVAALGMLVAGMPAQARTCTVDLDRLEQIRAEIGDLAKKSVHVDRDKAKGLAHKYLEELQAGKLVIDKHDLAGVASRWAMPSAAVIQQLLADVQSVVKSCERSAVGAQ
jgi:hypothetical protein